MADFGIGETLAATSGAKGASEGAGLFGLGKGAETAAAGAGADFLAPAAGTGGVGHADDWWGS